MLLLGHSTPGTGFALPQAMKPSELTQTAGEEEEQKLKSGSVQQSVGLRAQMLPGTMVEGEEGETQREVRDSVRQISRPVAKLQSGASGGQQNPGQQRELGGAQIRD